MMGKGLLWKWFAICVLVFVWSLFALDFGSPLQAQMGIDFNQNERSGSINLTTSYRVHHGLGGIILKEQGSLQLGLNGFFWLGKTLSTRFTLEAGIPLVEAESLVNNPLREKLLYIYEGQFAIRFALRKTNNVATILGVVMDVSEGHSGNMFLSNPKTKNTYLQTTLGVEFEMAFALGLEYLFYFRLKVPVSSYNSVFGGNLSWGFYPRQGSLELAFLFHKGPSFGLSKGARNFYFGPFYRFDIRVLNLTAPNMILSHTIGVTYYVKMPF